MGCTSEALFYESAGWVVREQRIFVDEVLASESIVGRRMGLA